MKPEVWRTGSPRKHPSPVVTPSGWQIMRQVLIWLVIVAVWGGVLALYVSVTGSSNLTLASAAALAPLPTVPPSPTPTVVAATATAAPATTTATATSTRPAATATATLPATSTRPTATATATATLTPPALPTTAPSQTKPPATPSQAGSAQVSFARDVQPIFSRVCVKCHGGEEVNEGLVLKTYAEIMAGSNNGPVIAPGDPGNSLLIDLITQGKMPKKGPKLLPGEIRIITNWVAAGAANN